MAALATALLTGALAAPLAVQAQDPPFPTPLPMCYVQPDPANDMWPHAVTDTLGSTAGVPVTFSGATLIANDSPSVTVRSVGPTSAGGGSITGTDPFTFTPSAPGDDSFPYEIIDGAGRTTMGIVKISVTGGDVVAPTVSISSPLGGPVSGSVLIRASASDNIGVTGVTFFDGASPISSVAAPFETLWATTLVANGSHSLTAVARDAAGNAATSSPVVVNVSNIVMVTVPGVVGLAQASAVSAITGATLTASSTTANSPTAAIGTVISQSPAGGSSVATGSDVALVVSVGALVPGVVGSSQAAATTAITAAGLVVGTTNTTNNAAAAGTVISQSPAAGTNAAPGSAMTITVSLGPAAPTTVIVPGVVNLTQAAATTAITGAGLTVGAVTTATSSTVASGSVISQNPASGISVLIGSAVALVVSSGPPAPAPGGLVAAFGFDEVTGTTAVNSANAAFPGAIRQAIRVAGKIGKALSFDGVNDWVTVTDITASPLDLTNGMTMEAWVNPATIVGGRTVMMKERGIGLSYSLYANDDFGAAGPVSYIRAGGADQGVRRLPGVALPINTWTHLAATYDGVNQRLYINGALVATRPQTGNLAVANGALRIGGNNAWLDEFFQGLIDEVRIYNRALSAAEIAADMTTPVVP